MRHEADLLESMLQDADGVEVVHGFERTWGTRDGPDEDLALAELDVRDAAIVITVPTDRLTFTRGDTYRIAGVDYELTDWLALDDGALTAMALGTA